MPHSLVDIQLIEEGDAPSDVCPYCRHPELAGEEYHASLHDNPDRTCQAVSPQLGRCKCAWKPE